MYTLRLIALWSIATVPGALKIDNIVQVPKRIPGHTWGDWIWSGDEKGEYYQGDMYSWDTSDAGYVNETTPALLHGDYIPLPQHDTTNVINIIPPRIEGSGQPVI